jgi:hypothetical protein
MITKSFSYLILANTSELFLRETFLFTGKARQDALNEDDFYANRAMFYEGDNKIVILPFPIDLPLVEKHAQQLRYQNVTYWYPSVYNGYSLCASILNDSTLFPQIVACIAQNPNIVITSYAYSHDFEAFINALKQLDLQFQSDNTPHNLSIVRQLNSKAIFRRVVTAIESDLGLQLIPKGIVVSHLEAALKEIRAYVRAKKGFVVKASFGATGRGLFLSPSVPTENTIAEFLKCVAQDAIWTDAPLVVETKIIAKSVQSPSIELKISEHQIEMTYICNQILDDKGSFLGIGLGKNAVVPHIATQMRYTASLIATAYQSIGYRGFFDIDFILDDAQNAFAVETNVRRTGGTHIYDILRHLYGADWETKIYALSNDAWKMNAAFKKSSELLEYFKTMLYDGEEGMILTNFSIELDVFGFVLLAKTAENLQNYLNRLER